MKLIEDKNHFGRIMVAFVNAKTGSIRLVRERRCGEIAKNDYREQEVIADDDYEEFYPRIRGKKMLLNHQPISVYDEKVRTRAHQNMQTMPKSRIQRMNRGTLRLINKEF